MDLLSKIQVEDLRGEQRDLAELVGLETYIKLVRLCGGSDLYIAKADRLVNVFRDREIISKFDGYNQQSLAAEYGLSQRSIREIVSDVLKERKHSPIEGQISLF